MIVVVGSPLFAPGAEDDRGGPTGLAATIAATAAASGLAVQLVGKIGDDPAGDATLIGLASSGVAHAAVVRDGTRATPAAPVALDLDEMPSDAFVAEALAMEAFAGGGPGDPAVEGPPAAAFGLPLDAPDVELALRYLDGYRVVVVADPLGPDGLTAAVEAAAYAGAAIVVIVRAGAVVPDLPNGAIVLEAPRPDPGQVFARTVGHLAAGLARGTDPAIALREAVSQAGWEPAGGSSPD